MWVGDVIDDRFAIERPIGSGGMASVFVALDRRSGDRVAVKMLDLVGSDVEDRFGREARALAEVAHPNVVRYVANGRSAEGALYLAMEWLEGEDLSARLSRGALPLHEALAVVRRAAEGIAAAHARGIVHRDVKPSNLFLVDGDPSRLKVLDFGIARLGTVGRSLTRTGGLLGTVGYMAPEQALDPKRADARADVFSLGCVLYECLTGQPPYVGATPVAVLSKLLCDEPPPPSTLRHGLPPSVDELVMAMLARSIEQRPVDAAAVAERVVGIQSHSGVDATAPTVLGQFAEPPTISEQRTTSVLYVRGVGVPGDLVERVVGPFGATSAQIAEDTWVASLGGRGTPSDRARRAAACALALRDAAPVHVVLATGRAEATRVSLVGPAIDRAVALLDDVTRAPIGTVFIDDVTASLVESAFDVDRSGAHALLLGARADGGTRLLMGKPTPFVGREKDLAVLEATLAECVDEGVARLVAVTAPPGVGKSRLRYEFLSRVERRKDVTVFVGSGGALGSDSAWTLAKQLLRGATRAVADLPAGEQALRIQAHIGRVVAPKRQKHVAEFVAELLAVEIPGEPSIALRAARGDPGTMAELLPKALDEWFLAECVASPLLVVIDDLHWADGASVDLLLRAVRAPGQRALLVLAFARPEVRDAFPGLWALSPVHLPLSGLGPRAAERLARVVLGPDAKEEVLQRVVALADGNAFYLEELTRAIAEGRGGALPESVLAMAEARIDALEPEARRVLRAVSVIGERFSPEAAGAATGQITATRDWLEALAEREVLERSAGGVNQGIEFAFRHALLREAAYVQVVESERRSAHARIAAWLERQPVPDAIGLAQHWERAREPERAIPWLARGAEGAFYLGDNQAALAVAERGLALGAAGIDRGRIRLTQAACLITSDPNGAFALALSASEDLAEGSTEWFFAMGIGFYASAGAARQGEAAALLGRLLSSIDFPFPVTAGSGIALNLCVSTLTLVGQLELAERVVRRFEERARQSPAPDPFFDVLRLHAELTVRLNCRDSFAGLLPAARAVGALADEIGTAAATHFGQQGLGRALGGAGAFAEGEEVLLRALEKTRSFHPEILSTDLGFLLAQAGRNDEALAALQPAAMFPGIERLIASSGISWVLARAGALDDAEKLALELEHEIGPFPVLGALQRLVLATVARARGDAARALLLADQGLELCATGCLNPNTLVPLRLLRARSLHALSRLDEARHAIRHARDRVLAVRDSIEEPEIRARYVDAVPEARETLVVAEEWLGEVLANQGGPEAPPAAGVRGPQPIRLASRPERQR